MGFLKQLLGKYLGGGYQGGHGNKHGRNNFGGGKHGGDWFGNQGSSFNNPNTPNISGKICRSCNITNLAEAKFCQQCGATFAALNCSQCNATLLPDAKFCPQCGKAR